MRSGDENLREVFHGPFRPYCDQSWAVEWRANYLTHAERVRASRAKWLDPAFQSMLWDENPVSSIGPGSSVTVTGAYGDEALAARLFEIREAFRNDDLAARGTALQSAFDEILAWVYPTHSKRRPKARLVRLLALMFPHDMTCLMDAARRDAGMDLATAAGGALQCCWCTIPACVESSAGDVLEHRHRWRRKWPHSINRHPQWVASHVLPN
jgi:hypothetical protein